MNEQEDAVSGVLSRLQEGLRMASQDMDRLVGLICMHAVDRNDIGYSDMDEGWLVGWFANAIEHSQDVRHGTGPTVLPDGSAFFVS